MKKLSIAAIVLFCIAPLSNAADEFSGGIGETEYNGKPSHYEFSNGKFVWYAADREVLVKGTYISQGKYLIVTDVSGPRACLSESKNEDIEVGVYVWERWEGKIYLTVADDDCGGRQRGFLAASPYISISK
jgi:hypothetical protein